MGWAAWAASDGVQRADGAERALASSIPHPFSLVANAGSCTRQSKQAPQVCQLSPPPAACQDHVAAQSVQRRGAAVAVPEYPACPPHHVLVGIARSAPRVDIVIVSNMAKRVWCFGRILYKRFPRLACATASALYAKSAASKCAASSSRAMPGKWRPYARHTSSAQTKDCNIARRSAPNSTLSTVRAHTSRSQ